MRYAGRSLTVIALPLRVVPLAFGRSPIFALVVAATLSPCHGAAPSAVTIATVARRTDPDLGPATRADEDPRTAPRIGLDGPGVAVETLPGLRRLQRHDPPGVPDLFSGAPTLLAERSRDERGPGEASRATDSSFGTRADDIKTHQPPSTPEFSGFWTPLTPSPEQREPVPGLAARDDRAYGRVCPVDGGRT